MTTISRFSFLFIVLLAGCSAESGPGFRSVLWYDAPALDWSSEALPIGNGRLGAMMFGDPYMERIQLNEFGLPMAANVSLVVYDLMGREVRVLVSGMLTAGRHDASFDASDLPSGTYIYRLTTPSGSFPNMLTLLK
ncbi:glycoside hydrolase N-terminal domain-containing protein [bacterium]|nr:glycoside hydrolase N-terminal domain-containing protein [bacterium]